MNKAVNQERWNQFADPYKLVTEIIVSQDDVLWRPALQDSTDPDDCSQYDFSLGSASRLAHYAYRLHDLATGYATLAAMLHDQRVIEIGRRLRERIGERFNGNEDGVNGTMMIAVAPSLVCERYRPAANLIVVEDRWPDDVVKIANELIDADEAANRARTLCWRFPVPDAWVEGE